MTGRRLLLLFAALMFGAFGVYLALQPEMLEEWLGITASTPAGRIELSAFYGGLEIGLAVFFVIAAFRRSWHVPACAALGFGSLGIAVVRITGMLTHGVDGGFLYGALATELFFGIGGLVASRVAASQSRATIA